MATIHITKRRISPTGTMFEDTELHVEGDKLIEVNKIFNQQYKEKML